MKKLPAAPDVHVPGPPIQQHVPIMVLLIPLLVGESVFLLGSLFQPQQNWEDYRSHPGMFCTFSGLFLLGSLFLPH